MCQSLKERQNKVSTNKSMLMLHYQYQAEDSIKPFFIFQEISRVQRKVI